VFRMSVKAYRSWFIVGSLTLILAAAAPTLALFISVPRNSERFSELWLLGSDHKAEDYPFNVKVNETYNVYLGVGNHQGFSAYYRIDVKLRNQTQPLPDSFSLSPSPVDSVFEFQFFVADGKTWETPLSFSFQGKPILNEQFLVNNALINGVAFPVNCSSKWDQERNGFYYQLFFELWLYNIATQSFQYQNRFVAIWLNLLNATH